MWFSAVFLAQFGLFFLKRDYTINPFFFFLRVYSPQHVKFQLVNTYCQQYTVTNSGVSMKSEQQVNRNFLAKYIRRKFDIVADFRTSFTLHANNCPLDRARITHTDCICTGVRMFGDRTCENENSDLYQVRPH